MLVGGIVLVAANLRPALTSVAPLIGEIRTDTGMSHAMAGLLTTLPLLAFGLFSSLAPEYGYRAGLIHVPYLPEQAAGIEGGAPSMTLGSMVEAVEIALRVSIETSEDLALAAGAIS